MATKATSSIPGPVINEATQLITNALTVLKPYLIALTSTERRAMAKMSDKSFPFVEKTRDYTLSAPQFIPPYMDAQQLQTNMEDYNNLVELLRMSKQLTSGLDDSALQTGGECYTNALNFYNSVKQAAKINIPGAKSIYEDLSKRFVKSRTEKESETHEIIQEN